MKELKKESKAMNAWMDETEKLVGSLRIDMDPKKASRVQQKIDVSMQTALEFIKIKRWSLQSIQLHRKGGRDQMFRQEITKFRMLVSKLFEYPSEIWNFQFIVRKLTDGSLGRGSLLKGLSVGWTNGRMDRRID